MLRTTFLSLLLVLSTPWTASGEQQRPDFTGTWQLNEELSEDPREKMREQLRRGGGFGRGGAGGGFGRGGSGGGFGGDRPGGFGGQGQGQRGGQGQGQRGGGLQSLGQGAERLEIVHDGASFEVVDAADRARRVEIDGEARELNSAGGETIELSAEWKRGNRIELSLERPERPTITETYELIAGGAKLYVDVEIEGSGRRPSLKFRRVYDRAEPELPAETEQGAGSDFTGESAGQEEPVPEESVSIQFSGAAGTHRSITASMSGSSFFGGVA